MAMIPLVCTGDYNILVDAIDHDDINSFCNALNSVSEMERSKIFEVACRSPGRPGFIDACILAGCDVNGEVNKRPIIFAAESYCEKNLVALLKHPNVDVDAVYSSFKLTPIHVLTEQISDDSLSVILPCIKLLVQHGINVDLPDWQDRTPITLILTNQHLNIANQEVILRSLNLAKNIQINEEWDFIRLLFLLKRKKEDEFIDGLKNAEKNRKVLRKLFTASVGVETLLTVAARENSVAALEKMIQLGADVNFVADSATDTKIKVEALSAAQSACDRGHWKSLKILLKSPELDVNSAPLLHNVVHHFTNETTENIDYEKCLEILLNHPNIDINLHGEYKHTALHCAILLNKSKAVLALLQRGAFIGGKDVWGGFAVSRIDPNVLEEHFDSCITTNDLQTNDSSFEIEFDFKNLVPNVTSQTTSIADEMCVIEYMSKSIELKHLTMHPLIATFQSMKWSGMAPFFYVNFFLCVFYATLTVLYILLYYNYHEQNTTMRVIIWLLSIHITVREILQMKCSPLIYMKNLENYFEWSMLVLVWLIIFDVGTNTYRRSFAASSILLVSIEIFLLAGSLPFWSFCTHYVMLKTVTWSFLKSLLLYAIIPLAFSLSFFSLLHEPFEKSLDNAYRNTSDSNNDDDLNKFANIGMSIMKTLVMSTGEFEAASINLKTNTFNYIVFIIFIFIIVIVLLNLLNGLAVNDTQTIKAKAELTNFVGCVQVMACYERYLTACYPVYFRLFPLSAYIQSFEELKSVKRIAITPNNDNYPNRIVILNPQVMRYDRGIFLDAKILKVALHVLKKKRDEQHEIDERNTLMERITKMEITMEKIAGKMNEILERLK